MIVCFASSKQDGQTTAAQRMTETAEALMLFGLEGFEQWPILDTAKHPEAELIRLMRQRREKFSHVFAPAIEENGHEQHTLIGQLAVEVWGSENVTQYLTYMRGSMRSTSQWEVPFEPLWPAFKLAAMSCYHSQIKIANTLPWFIDGSIREYYAHEPAVPAEESVGEFLDRHAPKWARDDELRSVL